ncbi:ferroxidase fet3 [Linderina pennispora]|nr:ferroxidase fet3 [Linderina pennispora]
MQILLSLLLATLWTAFAKRVVHNWDITYVTTSRGLDQKPKCGIAVNGTFPLPIVRASKGDTLVLHVHNSLNVSTSLHAHGIFQNNTNYYDGTGMVTECSIAPGTDFTYEIPLNQAGTYWIHGHTAEQNFDGLSTPLIIDDPDEPYRYDGEYLFAFEDWSTATIREIRPLMDIPDFKEFRSMLQPLTLVNGISSNYTPPIHFSPGKTYRIRLVAMQNLPTVEFSINQHTLEVIEVDGALTKRRPMQAVRINPGQRVSMLVRAKQSLASNYAYHISVTNYFSPIPPGFVQPLYNGTVIYAEDAELAPVESVLSEPFDEVSLESLDELPQLIPDRSLFINSTVGHSLQNIYQDTFNNVEFMAPPVPTIFSALTLGQRSLNPFMYGPQTNAHVLKHLEVVELLLYHTGNTPHPLHLHGHSFQVIARGLVNDTTGEYHREVKPGQSPVTRDTIFLIHGEYALVRFRADNPGAWLFHCHVVFHAVRGMMMVFVEAPDVMQQRIKVPESVVSQCRQQGIKTTGNVVGNMGYNIAGAPHSPDLLFS